MAPRKPWFELRKSTIQGKGAFALRDIPEGQKLIEYTGERITADEASRRYDDSRVKRHHTFLFELGDQRCIDAKRVGSDARFINHSCEPNCEALQEGYRIFIYAKDAIPEGTELTYDYQYVIDGPLDAETRALYACRCGAPRCRGTIAVARPRRKTSRKKPTAERGAPGKKGVNRSAAPPASKQRSKPATKH
jgi:SET domain-containing protein